MKSDLKSRTYWSPVPEGLISRLRFSEIRKTLINFRLHKQMGYSFLEIAVLFSKLEPLTCMTARMHKLQYKLFYSCLWFILQIMLPNMFEQWNVIFWMKSIEQTVSKRLHCVTEAIKALLIGYRWWHSPLKMLIAEVHQLYRLSSNQDAGKTFQCGRKQKILSPQWGTYCQSFQNRSVCCQERHNQLGCFYT